MKAVVVLALLGLVCTASASRVMLAAGPGPAPAPAPGKIARKFMSRQCRQRRGGSDHCLCRHAQVLVLVSR